MAKPIMIAGTMSNVGKSLFTAALCRIFKQDGFKTAPFKSQNMALNSFVTREGLEMGRAQVMQAEAAEEEPSVCMNPILLKPTDDVGSQVIICGEVIGNMTAAEYYKNKKKFVPKIMECYNYLDENYDIIVIEGAGSPAEINLKENDIVNMGMAEMAKAPVIIVGDIDRGGVFAQLVGTMALLDKKEKNFVKGVIINKFRGDKSILKPGTDMLENLIERPVLGVVPYIECDIDDEDSLSERFYKKNNTGIVDIAVIKLPKISNFTDFNIFERFDGVSVRYVKSVAELQKPDMIILPGSKSTVSDLIWLRESGLETSIKKCASEGKIIFGICGGFQMLGRKISDPYKTEFGGTVRAMELLPVDTVFKLEKTRTRVSGTFKNVGGILKNLENVCFKGYEIHMGISKIYDNSENMNIVCDFVEEEYKADGVCKGNVYGTYIHGVFDSEDVVKTILLSIMQQKGIDFSFIEKLNFEEYKNRQYDIIADAVRKNVDIENIYKIIEGGL